MEKKKFYIENLGCAKNLVDGESVSFILSQLGWDEVETPDRADYLLVNTCGFIQAAKEESLDVTLRLRNQFPDKKLIMIGCLSERYGEALFSQLSEVDGVFGNRNLFQIKDLVEKVESGERALLLPLIFGRQPSRALKLTSPGSTYVKIAEGCWNRCAYCAIPLIRGDLRSRPIKEIVEEIRCFRSIGTHEFNLIAQDLGSYGKDRGKPELVELLREIQKLPDPFWVRFLYIHPEHFPLELVELCKDDPRFLPYFDLPFQHASSRILRDMGRRKGREENLKLIHRIRQRLPGAVIRSTFLVGFPGETEEDFQELREFQAEACFDWLGVFTYSPEENTPAALLDRQRGLHVKKRVALERKRRIEEAQNPITFQRLDRFVGQTLEVLVEEKVEGENLFLGRSYAQAPEVDGAVVIHGEGVEPGDIVSARVIRRNGLDLEGVLVGGVRGHG